ncbi:Hypothetical predicted protein [Marmota monax]|uniref:Uncharacterized protein n=1 Tax=Marmota monax TaxID=9995 RepID=A0A5E4BL55_MARMO|nr:hypothetical protein GHT09_001395 [Marmota monax]VTJ69382.1 Hypothetical predicted protein [Marmota monax]
MDGPAQSPARTWARAGTPKVKVTYRHKHTLSSSGDAHRGRSPEEGRKSRRRHSRGCSKTLCKASPEARSSPPPSQPLQMLSLLSARGVVSIAHASSCSLVVTRGTGVEAQGQGNTRHALIQSPAKYPPLAPDLIINEPNGHSAACGSTGLGDLEEGGWQRKKNKNTQALLSGAP